jgi:hypothetical protein
MVYWLALRSALMHSGESHLCLRGSTSRCANVTPIVLNGTLCATRIYRFIGLHSGEKKIISCYNLLCGQYTAAFPAYDLDFGVLGMLNI